MLTKSQNDIIKRFSKEELLITNKDTLSNR